MTDASLPNDNWTARLAAIFVRNRRLSLLLTIALFAWGIGSYLVTPKQYNPRIVAPAFQIFVEFPGASRSEVLEQVVKPMENVVADIPGVEDVFTVTEQGGRAVATINFYVGEDLDSAKIALDDRVRSNLDLSPLGLSPPLIQSVDPDDVPVMTVALTSHEVDPVALRKFAFRLRDRLTGIPGASNLEVVGGRRRELAIQIDPIKLANGGVGVQDIERALQRANVYLPLGEIKTDERYIPLEGDSSVQRPEDLANLAVVSGDFGQLTLSDVATIHERVVEAEHHVRHVTAQSLTDGAEPPHTVLLSIAKTKDANISDVTGAVQERLNELDANFTPQNINTAVIVNEGRVAREEIGGLVTNLFTAVAIVVVILLIFLDRRAAILVAVSIPLTLACVFGAGYLLGHNINRITLFALILSLGLLVDNATVVIENIVRRLQEGVQDAKAIIIDAVGEVGPGLFMSTVTTVLAFLPMAFVTGMMGPYMGPIPFFVPAALVFSLLLSFTINPYMASALLQRTGAGPARERKPTLPGFLERLLQLGPAAFEAYRRTLHDLLTNRRRRTVWMSVIGLALLASFVLPGVALVKFRMLPKADREQFFLYVDMPAGTSLERTFTAAQAFEDFLLSEPEVRMIQSYVGRPPILDFNGLFRGVSARSESRHATLRVGLSHPDDRPMTSEELVLELRPRLIAATQKFAPEAQLTFVEDPPGPPVLSTMLVRLQGYDDALLEQTALDLLPRVREIDGVTDLDSSVPEDTETLRIVVNQERASRSRLSPAQIVETLSAAYDGSILGIYHNPANIEQEYITLRYDRRFRADPAVLQNVYLYNDLGIRVRLLDLARVVPVETPKPLRRENRSNTVYLLGEMGDRSITYAAIDLLYLLVDYAPEINGRRGELESWSLFGAKYRFPDGRIVDVSIGGEWELTLEVFRDLGIAMGVAIFLVYFVLTAQFKSFREPLIIMSTIPLSLIGVLPGFMVLGWITGEYFTATSMIGVIALAGIAVNNSIILLEYLNSLKGKLSLEAALVEAGTTRFRPILLTTVTTILGSTTIAGDPVWAGLAYAIIFGLGVSSLLTLIVFPVLFLMIKGRDWPAVS